jgi:predicted tellurium resistance membrane protein TerC
MEFVFAVLTLAFLEIVLGVDNIMFISIVTNKLPDNQQNKARLIGLGVAMITRIILLIAMVWLIDHLTKPFFPLADVHEVEETIGLYKAEANIFKKLGYLFHTIGVRELVLLGGGIFLLTKSVSEIHHKMEGESKEVKTKTTSFIGVIIEIIAVDLVFSFDSILTAIGITHNLPAMIIAIVIAIFVMLIFAKKISQFMHTHPTLEVLGLSFLILIGFMLILDSVHIEVPKGYIYFAVFFSLLVEVINLKITKRKSKPVELRKKLKESDEDKEIEIIE